MKFENLEQAMKYGKEVERILKNFEAVEKLEKGKFKKNRADDESKANVRITFEHYGRVDKNAPTMIIDDDNLSRDVMAYAKLQMENRFNEISEKVREL